MHFRSLESVELNFRQSSVAVQLADFACGAGAEAAGVPDSGIYFRLDAP
jgi:hypothetical protein